MAAKRHPPIDPDNVVVEGIETVIERDLAKHVALLARAKAELTAYRAGVSHEVKRKRVWKGLIGGERFDDDALRAAIRDININIRHLSDKCKLTEESIAHQTLIVDTLTAQLQTQRSRLEHLAAYRRKHDGVCN